MNSSDGWDNNESGYIEGKLPLTVTSITPQKKSPDRFSLFHEKLFLIGVSAQTLLNYSIQKGVELTPSLFRQLHKSEEYSKVKESFYRYLGRRDHTGFELRRKVQKKKFSSQVVDEVLKEFESKGLLNDRVFAEKFAADKFTLNQWGPVKIKSALIKKGVRKEIAKEAIENELNNLEQDQICVDLARKRKRHFLREEDPFKRKQKIYAYLAGKGYTGTVIKKAMPEIIKIFDA